MRAPRPAPVPRQGGRRRGPVAAGLLAGLLVLGGVGYGLSSLGGGSAGGTGGSSPSAGPSSGDGSSNGSGSDGGASDPPAGFRTYTGDGWTVAVPASYAPGRFKGRAQYRDPDTGRTLRVTTGKGVEDAVRDREQAAAVFARTHRDYRQIGITGLRYRGSPAADWEFTYTDGGAQLHVLNRVVDVDGTGNSLFFQVRAADWPAAKADFDEIVAAYQPAGR